MKIGISLLTHNDSSLLIPCLNSLFQSDIRGYNFKLFAWDNNSTDETREFLNSLNVEKKITEYNDNLGIVIPRIKLYEQMKEEGCDFLLEIHADMLFPKFWITELLKIDDKKAIILEPHILQTNRKIDLQTVESKIKSLREEKVYKKCLQVHPWLVKIDMLEKIGGYYDDIYSPQRCEDDDLVWRILSNGYEIRSTKNSWVFHYGGVTRHRVLGSAGYDHKQKLCKKFGIEFEQIKNLTEIHPAVQL